MYTMFNHSEGHCQNVYVMSHSIVNLAWITDESITLVCACLVVTPIHTREVHLCFWSEYPSLNNGITFCLFKT